MNKMVFMENWYIKDERQKRFKLVQLSKVVIRIMMKYVKLKKLMLNVTCLFHFWLYNDIFGV